MDGPTTLDSRMRTMLTRGTLCAGGAGCALLALVVFIAALAAGCNNQAKTKPAADAAQPPPPAGAVVPVQERDVATPADGDGEAPRGDQMEASVGTADALARKAETYSREIASLLAGRPARDAAAPPAPAPAEPSQVQWADPIDFRLGDAIPASGGNGSAPQPPSQAQQPVQPVIQTSPSQANQIASITPTPEQNVIASANTPARADGPTTNPSTTPAAPAPAPMSLASSAGLSEKLATRVREYPRDVSGHLEYQLLQ